MDYISLKARAKINLTLDIVGKREDGYHLLTMLMQTIGLYDNIYIRKIQQPGIKLKVNLPWLSIDDKNLVYRAAEWMMHQYPLSPGLFIELQKHVPVAAGLGGGSSDCAAVLKGINLLFGLRLSTETLMQHGLQFGADVPYFFLQGTCLAEGIGEILKRVSPCPPFFILIAKPKFSVTTGAVYSQYQEENIAQHPDTHRMLAALQEKDTKKIGALLCNVLESVTLSQHTEIEQIKKIMLQHGAVGALMSGSGPSVFGLFDHRQKAEFSKRYLKNTFLLKEVFITNIYNKE